MLAATAIFTTAAFAQVNTGIVNEERIPATAQEQILIDQFSTEKLNSLSNQSNSNNKGLVSGRADYAARLFDILGSTVEYAAINPMMPDSTTFIAFDDGSGGLEYVETTSHAIGMVYDPTEAFFTDVQFTSTDEVIVDSVFVDFAYYINNAAHTNDSIIFRLFVTPANDAGPLDLVSFAGLDGVGDVTIPLLDYVGSANHGVYDGITGTPNQTLGHLLTGNDTIGGSSGGTVGLQLTTPITIPAGQVMAVFVDYIPTAYAEGDTSDLVNRTGAFNLFRPYVLMNTGGSTDFNSYTGLANGSSQHNTISVRNDTRYNTAAVNTSDVGDGFFALSTWSNSIYLSVSGNSSVGINEEAKNVRFNVFPNPSKGVFNLNLSSNDDNNVNLTVKNVVGQTVITETVNVSGNTNHQISLTDYSKGIYFLTIGNETVKLIVE